MSRIGLLVLIMAPTEKAGHREVVPSPPPTFTQVLIGPPDITQATKVNWGDYDGDGDLDLAVEGFAAGVRVSRFYKFDGTSFQHDTGASLLGFTEGPFVFGDYDGDGDLDVVVGGWDNSASGMRIYRNDGGSGFAFVGAGLKGMKGADAAWADLDNDGDLDLILAGESIPFAFDDYFQVYRNDGGGAFSVILDLPGVYLGEVSAGDYDRDGDFDLAVAGRAVGSRVYRNDGGHFTDLGLSLEPVMLAATIEWGDYDADGDLDFVLSGEDGMSNLYCEIYRNDGGDVFTPLAAGLPPLRFGEIDWGDYDNDGDLDLVMVGVDSVTAPNPITRVYRNDAGVFVDAALGLAPLDTMNSAAWGDYDNDGDLDLVLAGNPGSGAAVKIYRNDSAAANTVPGVPGGLSAVLNGSSVTFQWTASTDAETPAVALSYNLRVGTTPGGQDVMPAHADVSSGFRRVPASGNGQTNLSWTLRRLPPGTYYYSVQSVDSVLRGSAWAAERSTVVPPAISVVGSTLVLPVLTVTLDRPPDPGSVDATSVRLSRVSDGAPLMPASVSVAGSVITVDLTGVPFPLDTYELRVSGTPRPPISHPGLYAHWRLDEGAGTSTADASGNGNTGTLVGAGWTSGLFGGALGLNQATTRVEVGSGVLSPPWTVGLWVNRLDSSGVEATLMDSDGALVPGTSLRLEQGTPLDPSNRTGFAEYGVGNYRFNYTMPVDEWTHLTFLGSALGTSLYVNGKFQDSVAQPIDLYVQRLGGHRALSMKGSMDEVQVYGRTLSGAEILALVAATACVRGADGLSLDGDGDGSAGGDFAAVFSGSGSGPSLSAGGGGTGCGAISPEFLLPFYAALVLLGARRRDAGSKRIP